jgi:opacity protein-like surface antigen
MRILVLALILAIAAAGVAGADSAARLTLGDIPRTFSHFLNAEEAALCRSDAALGGLPSYFLNPAAISEVTGVAGHAAVRQNFTSRDYLPTGAEHLESSDDGFLFSQVAAVKRSGSIVFGFGYSSPSYRSLELAGEVYSDDVLENYRGEFHGALRYFELLAATRIGSESRGGVGLAAGIVNLTEEARETTGQEFDSAKLDGTAASLAAGFTFDATDAVSLGIGYRWGVTVKVDGEWYEQTSSGKSKIGPTTVLGVRVKPIHDMALHVSYLIESWDRATSSLAAYTEAEGGPGRDQFDEPLKTVAVGAEMGLMNGRLTLRAGGSKVLGNDITNAIVPEGAVGLGGAINFEQYSFELSLVREQFAAEGESGGMVTYGLYGAVAYAF